MAFLAPERSWLFNPSTMKQVHQCRRLIQSEFGVKVHLTDKDLVEQLANYAGKSRSDGLARIWTELKTIIPGFDEEQAASGERPGKTYRGQPVADDEPGQRNRQTRSRTIIYRGQVVSR